MSSTPVLEAASISITSTGAPETKSWQDGHALHASGPLRWVQASALARSRAVVVLPTPRGPVKRYACATRPDLSAFCSVRVTGSWPTTASNTCGRQCRARTWYVTPPPSDSFEPGGGRGRGGRQRAFASKVVGGSTGEERQHALPPVAE